MPYTTKHRKGSLREWEPSQKEDAEYGLDKTDIFNISRRAQETFTGEEDRTFFDAMVRAGIKPSKNIVDLRSTPQDLKRNFGEGAPTWIPRANPEAFEEALKSWTPSENVEIYPVEKSAQVKAMWNFLNQRRLNRGQQPLEPDKVHEVNPQILKGFGL